MSTPRVFDDPRQLLELTEEPLGVSDWFLIDQERVDQFAEATGDHQWIHVDPERSASGPYGTAIVHGFLLLSMLPLFGAQLQRVDGIRMAINYGLDRVRFIGVVPVGSRVRSRAVLLSATEKASGIQSIVQHTVELESTGKPVMVAEQIRLLMP